MHLRIGWAGTVEFEHWIASENAARFPPVNLSTQRMRFSFSALLKEAKRNSGAPATNSPRARATSKGSLVCLAAVCRRSYGVGICPQPAMTPATVSRPRVCQERPEGLRTIWADLGQRLAMNRANRYKP